MSNREEILDIIVHTPCVAVSSKTAAEHILDNLISQGVLFNNWISVKDRLPEVGVKVLVYSAEKQKNDYEIGAYSDTYKCFFVGQFCYENITHWQPLPEPPKMKGVE